MTHPTKVGGEILEFALESVISFNQGKNVFDFITCPFGDKYDEQVVATIYYKSIHIRNI